MPWQAAVLWIEAGCFAAIHRASKKTLSRWPAEAAHRGPGSGRKLLLSIWLDALRAKKNNFPPLFSLKGGKAVFDRKSNSRKD